jgi:peptide/nickel transport system permease protein
MGRYIVRRLLQALVMLILLSVGFFALLHLLPGGPEAVLFNPRMTLETRLALRHSYGLDQPGYAQYFFWLTSVLRGNFGNSFADGQPVTAEIAVRAPYTFWLFVCAFGVALAVAIPLGVIAAVRQYSLTDYLATVLSYFGISMPIFFFALMLQIVFGHVGVPTFGASAADTTGFSVLENFEDRALHLFLPTFVLSLAFIAGWSRYLRSSMLDVIKQDYIRTARAKGLGSRVIFFRHALRNALIPFITQVALDFGAIAGGATITETVFGYPGLGRLFFDSLTARDYPILQAMLILGAASVIIFNLLADVLYAVVDPRIRYA